MYIPYRTVHARDREKIREKIWKRHDLICTSHAYMRESTISTLNGRKYQVLMRL